MLKLYLCCIIQQFHVSGACSRRRRGPEIDGDYQLSWTLTRLAPVVSTHTTGSRSFSTLLSMLPTTPAHLNV